MSISDAIIENNNTDIETDNVVQINPPSESSESSESSVSNESNDEKCSVCLLSIDSDSYTTNCNHTFCKVCIEEWFNNNHNDCPMCRTRINECIHNYENTKIKIYFLNNNENNQNQDNRIELENRILRNIVKRYNCSLCFILGLFLWDKLTNYNCIRNYNLLKSEYDILFENYKALNNSYNNLYNKDFCSYDINDMNDYVDISLYSYHKIIGVCSIPVEYLYSCIINN